MRTAELGSFDYSFRSASLNGMMRSIALLESRIRISPERKHAYEALSVVVLRVSSKDCPPL
jgi:hypothetical protein